MPEAKSHYFSHHEGRAPANAAMRDSTRHLCAAAYLDQDFRERVIEEFVASDTRAVAPGFDGEHDLEKVVLHCLQARRLALWRDFAIVLGTALILLLLTLPSLFAISLVYLAGITLWLWRITRPRYRIPLLLAWSVIGSLSLNFFVLSWGLLSGLDEKTETPVYDPYTGTYNATPSPSGWAAYFQFQLENLFLLTILVVFFLLLLTSGHTVIVFQNMRSRLFPGSTAAAPGSPSPRVRRTMARSAGAQNGNLTLYSHENPFIGAGDLHSPWARSWGITLDLTRSAVAGKQPRKVDPLDLHARVWQRVNAMKGPAPDGSAPLPPRERIKGLHTSMHVVARGACLQYPRPTESGSQVSYQGHPLIDPLSGTPFSAVSQPAVEAIIQHPQSFIRCYQRMTVNSRGQIVNGRGGDLIAPADADDVSLSAFLYLAVEGHMLHAQFVAVPMTPVREEFKIVDYLPSLGTPSLLWHAWRRTWRNVPTLFYFAPYRIIRTLWRMGVTAVAAGNEQAHAQAKHDYGARISVRELASEPAFDTFIQQLDVTKYTRILERRINDALLDHLGETCGVDVSTYRAQSDALQNFGVIITGGTVSGQIATGAGAVQNQTPPPRP